MKNWFKKASSMLLTLSLLIGLITVPAHAATTPLFTIEAENATLTSDLQVATSIYGTAKPGYTGTGFVWMQSSGTISFTVTVPTTGLYSITTRYMQELSTDGRLQYLTINGVSKGSFMLPYTTTWSNFDFGYQKLTAGTNTIQLQAGWGFAYFDSFTVDYANLDPLNPPATLTDSQATPQTQLLMNYLTGVYGDHIVSGQQEIYGGGNNGNYELEFDWIHNLTGKYPAIRGFDFMNYNPLYGWEDGTTNRVIDWVNNRGGIATASWHINVPKNFTSYTLGQAVDWKDATYKPTETDFNTANAVVPGTKEYQYLQLAIQDLAEQLQILQNNDVPIMLRPFHEAEGNGGANGEGAWFWWAKAGAVVYKQMWNMLYTELTQTYGLHNIIWIYNSYTYSTSPQWYPGDDKVDIVGYDKYNTVYNRTDGLSGVPNEDAISSIFYQLVNLTSGKKMVAMTENDTIPSLQNLTEEKAGWLYFCPWYGEFITSSANNNPTTLTTLYQSDYVITLDELPNLKVSVPSSSITPTSASFDKKTANQADITVTMTLNGNTLSGIKNGSTSLVSGTDYTVTGTTVTIKKSYLAAQAVGTTNLTFDFNAGTDPVLAVSVVDTTPSSTITPTSASFDKNTANQADIAVTLTLNGNTLSGIKNGSTSLVSGTDYTVSGTAVTIKKSYLAAQAVGTTNLTFDFSAGTDPVLAVSVVDTTVALPGALTLSGTAGNAQAALTWTASSGATSYKVERATGSGTYAAIASGLTALTYTDSTAVNGTLYNYRVVASNSGGSTTSNVISLTPASTTSTGSLKIQMYSGNTTDSSNTIAPRIKLVNTGTTALDLTTVKLRYYYTVDATNKTQAFWCDWAGIGSSNVTGTFVTMASAKTGADTYFEIGFTSGAGSLAAGASTEIQIRIARTDWTNYTQSNDYSFSSTGSSYVDWTKMTGYVNGSLQWGIEP
ncbi:mannan endo-1,4-beta-mannosidase [Paenibacillus cellulosilyticus]|uniref:Mannan endo-1,4-beta-mannosidase n=1 Tax=Paenibacillus cellulosilyticus TaxID=375489 RepID=A0A2V2YTE2_9BACL|nr:X2-like carbohydrate binding domain-containing protein [Paenibacillus cellulosilyticus]PWW02819.1 mannan endo-1,4-beta-mannosidase [Paenibacillus cellulosilyticus]QKS45740.1 beta-mannosidase [Paenibacillus cellulosilyticus]